LPRCSLNNYQGDHMGSIQIFSLEFSGTRLAVSRDFTGGYRLQAGDYTILMTPPTAQALAEGGRRIRTKAQVASHFGREMKPGATFRRDLLAVDGRTVHVEIGIADTIDGGVYLEICSTRMALTDQQAQTLLAVLENFADDVNVVLAGGAQRFYHNLAPGLAGPGWIPDWADDKKW
jgi:hypothetical protein